MASRRNLFILALCSLLAVAAGRKPKTVVSFHLEETETQSSKFVIPIKGLGSPPKTYYFRKIPEITDRKINGYYKFPAKNGGGYGVAFRLNTQGRNTLESVTSASRGKRLLTAVGQRPVNFVLIDGVINHGYIVVWSGLTTSDIEKIAKVVPEIRSGTGTEEVEEPVYTLEKPKEKRRKRGLGIFRRKKESDARGAASPSGGTLANPDDFAPVPN